MHLIVTLLCVLAAWSVLGMVCAVALGSALRRFAVTYTEREVYITILCDKSIGDAVVHIMLKADDDSWSTIAEQTFGPFDTAKDITDWCHRQLVGPLQRPLR